MKRKGFGFRDRFKDREPEGVPRPVRTDGEPIPVVLYCPLQCPKCGSRHPHHRGVGRGRLPLHYLTCRECGIEYHAQQTDIPGLIPLAKRLHGE